MAAFNSSPRPRGGVAQLVRALPCHGRGRGFESRRSRHRLLTALKNHVFLADLATRQSPLPVFVLAMAAMPSLAIRSWSAARVYRLTSVSVRCPLIAAITFALQPASASLRQAAFRNPWAAQSPGNWASLHCSRNQFPKPAAVNGFLNDVVRSVRLSL